jgi:hypothetical protein
VGRWKSDSSNSIRPVSILERSRMSVTRDRRCCPPPCNYQERLGAEAGTRTPTPLRALDPESSASANSATSARRYSTPGVAATQAGSRDESRFPAALKFATRTTTAAPCSVRTSRATTMVKTLRIACTKPMSVCRSSGGMGSGAAVTSRLSSTNLTGRWCRDTSRLHSARRA